MDTHLSIIHQGMSETPGSLAEISKSVCHHTTRLHSLDSTISNLHENNISGKIWSVIWMSLCMPGILMLCVVIYSYTYLYNYIYMLLIHVV